MSEPELTVPPPRGNDPATLGRALEAELIAQRATWARRRARRGLWRGLSLLFLLLVVLGALVAWFYFASELRPRGNGGPNHSQSEPDR